MNPFELVGPDFLAFYFGLSLVVILTVWMVRRGAESGPAPKIDLSNPYLIAYLRGGENEALRLGVVSLVDRGLLMADGAMLARAERTTSRDGQNRIEQELLKKFGTRSEAASIFKDANLKAACLEYRQQLEKLGLLPDEQARTARWMRFGLGALLLGGTAAMKVSVGLSRERPVAFLVILGALALAAMAVASFPRLTPRGRAMLADAQTMYAGLRDQASLQQQPAGAGQMMMLAAVFGVAALAPTEYAFARTLFPQASSSGCGSSCGASSSSSCSSGGDGGGSGCGGGGGCGGCGSS
ncbi:MAG: TIGR04222 domain-containing membrane protein [Blastocatellia bacterium]|nr:TIGR04222 domain-containing membrane protein [Blastocatellia bacterium]